MCFVLKSRSASWLKETLMNCCHQSFGTNARSLMELETFLQFTLTRNCDISHNDLVNQDRNMLCHPSQRMYAGTFEHIGNRLIRVISVCKWILDMFELKPAGIWPSLTEKKLILFSFKLWIFSFNFHVQIGSCVKKTVVLWQGLHENETEFIEKTDNQNISIISILKTRPKDKRLGDTLNEKTSCYNQLPVAHKECGILSEEENGLFSPFWCKIRHFFNKHTFLKTCENFSSVSTTLRTKTRRSSTN